MHNQAHTTPCAWCISPRKHQALCRVLEKLWQRTKATCGCSVTWRGDLYIFTSDMQKWGCAPALHSPGRC